MTRTSAALEERIDKQDKRIENLEARFKGIIFLLESKGITWPWMSPKEASVFLGISDSFLIKQLQRAEANPRNSDYKLGIHFRYKADPNSVRKYRLVNVLKFQEVMNIALEKRKSGN